MMFRTLLLLFAIFVAACDSADTSPKLSVSLDNLIVLDNGGVAGENNRTIELFQSHYRKDNGVEVNDIPFYIHSEFSEGLFVASRKPIGTAKYVDLMGYVDAEGRTIIPFQYKWAEPFHQGRARANVEAGIGIIDTVGKWIIPPGKYEWLGPSHNGRCFYLTEKKWGILDIAKGATGT